jgi:hypothetical protein
MGRNLALTASADRDVRGGWSRCLARHRYTVRWSRSIWFPRLAEASHEGGTSGWAVLCSGAGSERSAHEAVGVGHGLSSRHGGREQTNAASPRGREVTKIGLVGGDAGVEFVEIDRGQKVERSGRRGRVFGAAVLVFPRWMAGVGGARGLGECRLRRGRGQEGAIGDAMLGRCA